MLLGLATIIRRQSVGRSDVGLLHRGFSNANKIQTTTTNYITFNFPLLIENEFNKTFEDRNTTIMGSILPNSSPYNLNNPFRTRIFNGQITPLMSIKFVTGNEIAMMRKMAGIHAVFIDMEHSTLDLHTVGQLILACNYKDHDSLKTLHCIFLLIIYTMYSPFGGSTWHLLGLARNQSVSLRLHREPHPGCGKSPEEITSRRNFFWSLYTLDRLVDKATITIHRTLKTCPKTISCAMDRIDHSVSKTMVFHTR